MSGNRRWIARGKGQFPLDMLRYDQCFPETGSDAARLRDRHDEPVEIALLSSSANGPTTGRWESFGWRIEEVSR